jgi:hypothetical protein
MNEFKLSEQRFRSKPLTPEISLQGLVLLAPAFGEILERADFKAVAGAKDEAAAEQMLLSEIARAIPTVLSNFSALPKLAPFFYSTQEVLMGTAWVTVELFKRDVFEGKPLLHLAWLIACIKQEYADFLGPSGLNTLKDLMAVLGFQVTLKAPGPSGA